MKRLMIVVVFVGLILSGCASTTGPKLCKQGATSDDYTRDRFDCSESLRPTGKLKANYKFFMSQCLQEKGWSKCKEE
jgi:uncharacterized protein YceK